MVDITPFRHQWTIVHFDRLLGNEFERFPLLKAEFQCGKDLTCHVDLSKIEIDYSNNGHIKLFISLSDYERAMIYSVGIWDSAGKLSHRKGAVYLGSK